MKKTFAITITRQFSCNGQLIAEALSKELGIEFYDKVLVKEVAKKLHLSPELIGGVEETTKKSFIPFGMGHTLQDDIFNAQNDIIKELANKESGIFVGRLSDYVLADNPNNLSIYLFTSYENRIQNCKDRWDMNEKDAKKLIDKIDKARAEYRKKYAPDYDNVFANKQIMLDSSYFGAEGTAQLIAQIARKKFELN